MDLKKTLELLQIRKSMLIRIKLQLLRKEYLYNLEMIGLLQMQSTMILQAVIYQGFLMSGPFIGLVQNVVMRIVPLTDLAKNVGRSQGIESKFLKS